MLNKSTTIRGRNILLGSLVVLGLSVGPTAFNIRLHRGVSSRTRSTDASKTTSHVSIVDGSNNLLTKVSVCSRSPNDDWDKNDSKNIVAQTIPISPNPSSWFTLALVLIFEKLISNPISAPSSLGAGATVAVLAPYVATLIWAMKSLLASASLPNRQKQVAVLSGAFAVFRLLNFCASSISSWYMGLLVWSPLFTKAVTTATIGFLGDGTAQYLETRLLDSPQESRNANDDPKRSGKSSDRSSSASHSWLKNYNRRRGLSVFGENIFVSGPLLHFAYNAMEDLLPTTFGGRSAILAALGHALIDNFVLDTIFLSLTFVTTGIAEGYIREIIPQFRKDFLPTLKIGWVTGMCLLPVQFVLFRFFPLSLRVLGVNMIDVFWEAYISFMVHRRRRGDRMAQQQ